MTNEHLKTITDHYLIALLWTMGQQDDDVPENPGDSLSIHCDLGEGVRAVAERDCAAFVAACGSFFNAAMSRTGYGSHPDAGSPEASFGHDFALTRNGHGAGFWDRAELRADGLGDKLSALCGFRTQFEENNLYLGDDGKVYFDDMRAKA